MKKEFIPTQQALDLEKLGFDGHCLSYFEINNTGNQNDLRYFLKNGFNSDYMTSKKQMKYMYGDNSLLAPLYQQAFRWFREKYDLEPHTKKDWSDGVCWGYESIIECVDGIIDCGTYKTYEEAELECLKTLIEIVKKQK